MRWAAVIKAASHSEVRIQVNRPSSSISRFDSALRDGITLLLGRQPSESSANTFTVNGTQLLVVSQVHTVNGNQPWSVSRGLVSGLCGDMWAAFCVFCAALPFALLLAASSAIAWRQGSIGSYRH
jgi:hypothetical protein